MKKNLGREPPLEITNQIAPEIQAKDISSSGRWAEVGILSAYREMQKSGASLSQAAQQLGIPESTMRHWVTRAQETNGPTVWSEFFESPEGLQLLHQIVTAATFILTQVVGGGVRTLCQFLKLSGLWRFVASGYGTQCITIQEMEERILEFGKQQRERLAPNMPIKQITLTEDETFHVGEPCLLALEAISNFILVEEYGPDRRAKTWNAVVAQALLGLPVDVIQSTSDGGRALIKHVRESLGVHHSPDLFHVQQDISRATSLPLQRQVTQAAKNLDELKQDLEDVREQVQALAEQPRGPGRPKDYTSHIEQAEEALKVAEEVLDEARLRREGVREEARGISSSYHPFDLKTGQARDAATVEKDLKAHFAAIDQAADEAEISAQCRSLLEKARRLVPKMVATIAFVHTLIQRKIDELKQSEAINQVMLEYLIPFFYLKEVARKATTADVRDRLIGNCEALRGRSGWATALLSALCPEKREVLENVARMCAQFFQRSSSNVEGRNGVLALRHHSLHYLSSRKLQALTVIHNFVIRRRSDGSTAAERLFEQSHDDLFEHLLLILPPPKRPAIQRSRSKGYSAPN